MNDQSIADEESALNTRTRERRSGCLLAVVLLLIPFFLVPRIGSSREWMPDRYPFWLMLFLPPIVGGAFAGPIANPRTLRAATVHLFVWPLILLVLFATMPSSEQLDDLPAEQFSWDLLAIPVVLAGCFALAAWLSRSVYAGFKRHRQ